MIIHSNFFERYAPELEKRLRWIRRRLASLS
jgi:hypothetical protein